jgi:hypothetical protein
MGVIGCNHAIENDCANVAANHTISAILVSNEISEHRLHRWVRRVVENRQIRRSVHRCLADVGEWGAWIQPWYKRVEYA